MATITRKQFRANDSFPCGYEVYLIATVPDESLADSLRDFVTCSTYEQACEIAKRWTERMARQVDANAVDYAVIYVSGCDDDRNYQIKAAYVE